MTPARTSTGPGKIHKLDLLRRAVPGGPPRRPPGRLPLGTLRPGRLSDPTIEFKSSVPTTSQAQVIALLVTGTTRQQRGVLA